MSTVAIKPGQKVIGKGSSSSASVNRASSDIHTHESGNAKPMNSLADVQASPEEKKDQDPAPANPGEPVAANANGSSTNNKNLAFSRIDVPNGFLPPAFKECLLSNVVRSGRRALEFLKEVRESLSSLVAEDEHLSKGIKKLNPTPDILQLSRVSERLTVLCREAFIPLHRLNQTAIALYGAEDFLRYPKDIRGFDPISNGRIKVPDLPFNTTTVTKMRAVVDKATDYYNKFNLKGSKGADLQDICFSLMRAFQDLYTLMPGCQEVFKVLLYTTSREKVNLQEFLLALQSMERSDMLTEVQDLRRLVDELVIFLEKLSWGCFVVYRLASGKPVAPKQNDSAPCPEFPRPRDEECHPPESLIPPTQNLVSKDKKMKKPSSATLPKNEDKSAKLRKSTKSNSNMKMSVSSEGALAGRKKSSLKELTKVDKSGSKVTVKK